MLRILIPGLTALILTACRPADQTPAAEVAPAPTVEAAAATPSPSSRSPGPMSWEATRERYRQVEEMPSDPLEALEYRGVLCEYFSGEFGGDLSEHDRFLNVQMDRYRCGDELVAEARAMRASRADEPDTVARLDAIVAIYEP